MIERTEEDGWWWGDHWGWQRVLLALFFAAVVALMGWAGFEVWGVPGAVLFAGFTALCMLVPPFARAVAAVLVVFELLSCLG
jgi:predicted PurR-regulated permease PerM